MKMEKKRALMALMLGILLFGGLAGAWTYRDELLDAFSIGDTPAQAVVTTTNTLGETITTTPEMTTTTTTGIPSTTTGVPPGPADCSEASDMLSLFIGESDEGSDFETHVEGSMGIRKDAGASVSFIYGGVTIESTAIMFMHFQVMIEDYSGSADWDQLYFGLEVYGFVESAGYDGYETLGYGDDISISVIELDTNARLFTYDFEMNSYDVFDKLGASIYADGSVDTIVIGGWVGINLFSVMDNPLIGGHFNEWNMKVDTFEYCMDTSGRYDCRIELSDWGMP